jgi:hypothetical protein
MSAIDIERDEFDLWAESSEETTRKANNLNSLTMLANIDKWINEQMQAVEVEENDQDI